MALMTLTTLMTLITLMTPINLITLITLLILMTLVILMTLSSLYFLSSISSLSFLGFLLSERTFGVSPVIFNTVATAMPELTKPTAIQAEHTAPTTFCPPPTTA